MKWIRSTLAFSLLLMMPLLTSVAGTSAVAAMNDCSISKLEQNHSPLDQGHFFENNEDELEKDSEQLEELNMFEAKAQAIFQLNDSPNHFSVFISQPRFLSLLKVPIV